jgi:hypothetical protein
MPNGDNSVANRLSIAKPLFADRVRGCNQQFGKAISTKNHVFTFGARSKYRLESISADDLRTLSAHWNSRCFRKSFRGARKLLITTNCIDNAKKIRWGIWLHPFFDTIEFRICDAQSPGRHHGAGCAYAGDRCQITKTAPAKRGILISMLPKEHSRKQSAAAGSVARASKYQREKGEEPRPSQRFPRRADIRRSRSMIESRVIESDSSALNQLRTVGSFLSFENQLVFFEMSRHG